MKKYAFGADIGGTTIKLGLFETLGNLIEVWEIPTRIEENGKYILIDIAASIEEKLKEMLKALEWVSRDQSAETAMY